MRYKSCTVSTATMCELVRRYARRNLGVGVDTRAGPSEISIADPKAFRLIHSNNSPCVKGPWYNVLQPMVSLQMIRNKQEHSRRRKIWDKALNTKGMTLSLALEAQRF
jgi:hypothetical protein